MTDSSATEGEGGTVELTTGKEARFGKAGKPQPSRVGCFEPFDGSPMQQSVLLRPRSGMHPPCDGKVREDQARSRQMAVGADHLRRMPAMLLHDLHRVIRILDGVLGLALLDDCSRRTALGFG